MLDNVTEISLLYDSANEGRLLKPRDLTYVDRYVVQALAALHQLPFLIYVLTYPGRLPKWVSEEIRGAIVLLVI